MNDNEIIKKACKMYGLDSHLREITNKRDACTMAERLAMIHKESKQPMYVKNSYMYCDTLDCCFWIHNDKAYVSMSGMWSANSPDLTDDKLMYAVRLCYKVVSEMQKLLDERSGVEC